MGEGEGTERDRERWERGREGEGGEKEGELWREIEGVREGETGREREGGFGVVSLSLEKSQLSSSGVGPTLHRL